VLWPSILYSCLSVCEFSLALNQMMTETDRSHTEDTKFEDWHPQGCDGGLTETMRPTGPLCHRRSQEDKERSGAAIVSLACSARSEMQSGDLGCEGLQ